MPDPVLCCVVGATQNDLDDEGRGGSMSGRVEGKVALITGAARGQGRSHAVRLAQEGADIIAIDVCAPVGTAPYATATPDDLAQTAKEVESLGRRVVTAEVDVRDAEGLTQAVDGGVEQLGRLDIVSANAGILSFGRLDELAEVTWQTMIDINLTGVWHTTKAVTPHLVAAGGGAIVITNSGAGLQGQQNLGHYVSAKHGLVGLMRTLAVELAPHSIRVNCLHPSLVNTEMVLNEPLYQKFRPDLEHPTLDDAMPVFRTMNALPVPWIESTDVSNALLFLASDEGRYITGVSLPIDAGRLLK
jgi:SDR family mycofactocin-dependent oxidoreductase